MWISFGYLTESYGSDFELLQLRACFVGVRAWKLRQIRPKHYSTVVMGNNKNCTSKSMGMFWVQNRVIRVQFLTFPPLVVFGLEKVAKSWSKLFSVVLMGNDKNCTVNCVDIFRVQNQVMRARFLTLPPLVVFGLGKVIQIWPKYFSAVLTTNNKNCTPKSVGML